MKLNKKLLQTRVALVEDDEMLAATIREYLSSKGFNVSCFESAEKFEDYLIATEEFQLVPNRQRDPGIVLLDIRLKGMSGLSFFHHLNANNPHFYWPICFVTGHGDIAMAVETVRDGAFDFLTKPFEPEKLLDVIERASNRSRKLIVAFEFISDYRARLAKLTDKELEVMKYIVQGKTNKEVSEKLNNSTRTIELHRSRVFEKIGVASATELATVAERYDNLTNGS
jgi:two-component system response regulator DctR